MKFIAGLRVWGNWEIGENVLKVFLRLRGSANRRVDLFLPLIASISGRRQGARSGRTVASGQWPVNAKRGTSRPTPHAPRPTPHVTRLPESGWPIPLLVISGLATHGDGLRFVSRRCQHFCPRSGRFVCLNAAFSRHFWTIYGPSVQTMDAQLNALPTLPARARTVSDCLNSAFLGLFYTSCSRG